MIKLDTENLIDKKFIGIPYKLGGKSFDGADCIGAAVLWLNSEGIKVEYDDNQGPVLAHWWEHSPQRFSNAILQLGKMVRIAEVKKYDCLLFILGNEGNLFPSCVGVMVDDRHFIISTEERGSFVAMIDIFWKSKLWGAVRLHTVSEKEI